MIPSTFEPPELHGSFTLPEELEMNSVARASVTRNSSRAPTLTVKPVPDGFEIRLLAASEANYYALQVTTNLARGQWVSLPGSTNKYDTVPFLDKDRRLRSRFYRAVLVDSQ